MCGIVVLGSGRRTNLWCDGVRTILCFCLVVVGLSDKAEKLSSAILRSSENFISSESGHFGRVEISLAFLIGWKIDRDGGAGVLKSFGRCFLATFDVY